MIRNIYKGRESAEIPYRHCRVVLEQRLYMELGLLFDRVNEHVRSFPEVRVHAETVLSEEEWASMQILSRPAIFPAAIPPIPVHAHSPLAPLPGAKHLILYEPSITLIRQLYCGQAALGLSTVSVLTMRDSV
jgi:hypothetical protein